MDNKLFIVSGSDLLSQNPSDASPAWKKTGKAENIISIAGSNGKLYALNRNGELFETNTDSKIRWKKIGVIFKEVTQIAASANTFFATDGDGALWTTAISKKGSQWVKSESPGNIISFSSDNGSLYALTRDGVIYRNSLQGNNHKWLKIAYRNNETIKEDIRLISFLNKRIYGISSDNLLYKGEHRSEGNLTARALAIKGGEQTVVIVNVDICGLTGDFTGMVKKEISAKSQFTCFCCFHQLSHTHFAPVSQNWLTWQEANQRPDSIYLLFNCQKWHTECC